MDLNWIATTVIGLMITALGWFIKRMVSELEKKIERSDAANKERFEALEKRIEKQDERMDQMVKDLPRTYALRDDLIRMTQAIEARLDKIHDLLMNNKGGT